MKEIARQATLAFVVETKLLVYNAYFRWVPSRKKVIFAHVSQLVTRMGAMTSKYNILKF